MAKPLAQERQKRKGQATLEGDGKAVEQVNMTLGSTLANAHNLKALTHNGTSPYR